MMPKEAPNDLEARACAEDAKALRLWLRLLACTQLVEREVRGRLREEFGITLPRFDLMAQLERAPDGLKMSELSGRMMVTGGNVTGITDQLVAEGLVDRLTVAGDRRACRVRLTAKGRRVVRDVGRQHERWIVDAFGALGDKELATLHRLLGKVKDHARSRQAATPGGPGARRARPPAGQGPPALKSRAGAGRAATTAR
jgi:DNA-binding MarR family transcriptional regulator